MPTYLCHGFRWHRPGIRIFVILQDLLDAAPDWVIGMKTAKSILDALYSSHAYIPRLDPPEPPPHGSSAGSSLSTGPMPGAPRTEQEPTTPAGRPGPDLSLPPPRVPDSADSVLRFPWSAIKLLEEHDPRETSEPTRPYAFVADYAVKIDLHVDLLQHMDKYASEHYEAGTPWFERLRNDLQPGEEIKWYVVVCGDEERPPPDGRSPPISPERAETEPRKETNLRHKKSIGEGLRRMFKK